MYPYRDPQMPQPASTEIEEGVIDVLKNVSRRPIEPTLRSDLVADLGFDSLQVLEVIAELEDRFDISIPLNDARHAHGRAGGGAGRAAGGGTGTRLMTRPRTLFQALTEAAQSNEGYTFVVSGGKETRRSYFDIRQGALRVARSLREAGLRRGDLVALVIGDAEQFLTTLLARRSPASSPRRSIRR